MLAFFTTAVLSGKKKEQIIEMDNHRFRQSVFHRNQLDVWVSLFSSPDLPGHAAANSAFDDAFQNARGFIKFAYLDSEKCVKTPRRIGIRKLPAFCIFHPNGQTCVPGNISGRDLVNKISLFYPDFSKPLEKQWVDDINEPLVVLFSEKKKPSMMWSAISNAFYKHPIRVGYSTDHELAERLGVKEFPAIIMRNATHRIEYEGETKFVELKDTIKRFMQKKLQSLPHGLKIYSLKEFEERCNRRDMICVIDTVHDSQEELEQLRKKHRSNSVEFFIGKEELPSILPGAGKLYLYTTETGDVQAFDTTQALGEKLGEVLNTNSAVPVLETINTEL